MNTFHRRFIAAGFAASALCLILSFPVTMWNLGHYVVFAYLAYAAVAVCAVFFIVFRRRTSFIKPTEIFLFLPAIWLVCVLILLAIGKFHIG